jgi:hypothetical protein
LFYFSVFYVFYFCSFVSIGVNALNVIRQLILIILCLLFDDGNWYHYINRRWTFWGLLESLWLIKMDPLHLRRLIIMINL